MRTCMKAVSEHRGISSSLVRDKIKSERCVIWMDPERIPNADPYEISLVTQPWPDTYLDSARVRGTFESH